MIFSQERYKDNQEVINEMVFVHAEETDLYQDKFSLNPDFDLYLSLEEQGILRMYTARDEEGLAGYLIFLVTNHPHYKDQMYANNDLVYVKPEHRGGKAEVVRGMFSLAEENLKEEGISVICVSMKAHMPFDKTAEYMGYDKAEIVYSKYIKEDNK